MTICHSAGGTRSRPEEMHSHGPGFSFIQPFVGFPIGCPLVNFSRPPARPRVCSPDPKNYSPVRVTYPLFMDIVYTWIRTW